MAVRLSRAEQFTAMQFIANNKARIEAASNGEWPKIMADFNRTVGRPYKELAMKRLMIECGVKPPVSKSSSLFAIQCHKVKELESKVAVLESRLDSLVKLVNS